MQRLGIRRFRRTCCAEPPPFLTSSRCNKPVLSSVAVRSVPQHSPLHTPPQCLHQKLPFNDLFDPANEQNITGPIISTHSILIPLLYSKIAKQCTSIDTPQLMKRTNLTNYSEYIINILQQYNHLMPSTHY